MGFNEVARLAEANGIVLRAGCFCNVGACSSALNLSVDDVKRNYSLGRTCDDVSVDIVDGRSTGAIRISFGANSTIADCNHFLKFLEEKFLNQCPIYWSINSVSLSNINNELGNSVMLKDIYIYPIKSCGGMRVSRWPLTLSGLLYDRMWALVDNNNTIITQKKYPSLALLKISIDLENKLLNVSYNKPNNDDSLNMNTQTISIPINDGDNNLNNSNSTAVKVCGRRCDGFISCVHSNQWFSDYLGIISNIIITIIIILSLLLSLLSLLPVQVFNALSLKLVILVITLRTGER